MRTRKLAILFLLMLPLSAGAQKRPEVREYSGPTEGPSEAEIAAAKRRATGNIDVKEYGKSALPKEKPIPWMAIGLGFLVLLALSPLAYKTFLSTRKDLEDQATFGRKGTTPPDEKGASSEDKPRPAVRRAQQQAAAPNGEESPQQKANETRMIDASALNASANARDLVWNALSQAGQWVSAEWVAKQAKLPAGTTQGEIDTLVAEGYLEQTKDKSGRPVFRVAG